MNRQHNIKGSILLLITAAIWGFAFVAQSVGMDHVGPMTFQAARLLIGAIVLAPVIWIRDAHARRHGAPPPTQEQRKTLLVGGTVCGVLLCAAACVQQYGIVLTTVDKASFLTTMYILMVPLLGLFAHRRVPPHLWFCIALALVGMYFLCIKESVILQTGDLLILLCALLFALQIIAVDHYAPLVDPLKLSCLEFLVAGLLATVLMLFTERPSPAAILNAWLPIAYAGVCSCGIGYTLQNVAQKFTSPTIASLLMSFESVFATIGGILILHQIPSLFEGIGCAMMLSSVILAQIIPAFAKKAQ